MLTRELTFQMPYERLRKMGRSARWKAFPTQRAFIWLVVIVFIVSFASLFLLDSFFDRLQRDYGIPPWIWIAVPFGFLIGGIYLLRRRSRRLLKSRVDFDAPVRMRQEPEGLRFATPEIEYLIKWQGISQMMMGHDGVVVSHGSLLFMAPDEAFTDPNERNAFIRDVYSRLTDQARERSARFLKPILELASSPTGNRSGTT
jgi:uncharacterized membrane protein (DUF485 family)